MIGKDGPGLTHDVNWLSSQPHWFRQTFNYEMQFMRRRLSDCKIIKRRLKTLSCLHKLHRQRKRLRQHNLERGLLQNDGVWGWKEIIGKLLHLLETHQVNFDSFLTFVSTTFIFIIWRISYNNSSINSSTILFVLLLIIFVALAIYILQKDLYFSVSFFLSSDRNDFFQKKNHNPIIWNLLGIARMFYS